VTDHSVKALFEREYSVNRSLSFVFPVRNAEQTLAENLLHVFDVLSDLTERFEVLLVDEGSTDQTADLAHDLAVEYPQLRIAQSLADIADRYVVEAGADQTTDDVIVVQSPHTPFSPSHVRRLWEASADATILPLANQQHA
jgi:glycosyltransferase involved in cell wall biosynthesis